jgi:leucyl aminopeptidase
MRNPVLKIALPQIVFGRRAGKTAHRLIVLPLGQDWHGAEDAAMAEACLKRRCKTPETLNKKPLSVVGAEGALSVWLRLDTGAAAFEQHSLLRRGLQTLLDESPEKIEIVCVGPAEFCQAAAEVALRVALLNATPLPEYKRKSDHKALQRIYMVGAEVDTAQALALAEGNSLTRTLTRLPPNHLTPALYRKQIAALAKEHGWEHAEYDESKLHRLGAGAFLAVAQGSADRDAAIVRLSYKGASAKGKPIALVGKGVCFDTGGHNLKPSRYMHGMHEDMNGSAVALGILLAATRLKLPVNLTVWLALVKNDISPAAYRQNDVVTALDGTTIEVVHTDAEGRMILADTLALAAREKPSSIIDFATLTGSMHTALGTRYSGVMSNRAALLANAVAAGISSGERVCAFPMDADYDEALDSEVADVKQCTLEGEADHILAALFLQRFVKDTPWLHVDLSASSCKGGLGAVATELTGFGVGLGLRLLEDGLPLRR